MSRLPVDLLERDWRRELSSPLLRSRFGAWRKAEPALSRFEDLAGLLRYLRGPGPRAGKDSVLCALLMRARSEPLAGRVVLEAMMPGLMNLAGRILIDACEREEVWSALMACAWKQIRTYPVERRPRKVASNLLLDCLRGTLGALPSTRPDPSWLPWPVLDELEAHASWQGDADALLAEATAVGDVDALLAEARTAGAVSADEAELILATRIDGVQLRALADAQGVRFDTLKHRRNRAERRLLVWLGRRPVPQRGRRRPFCVARVAGAGPSGLAGGNDQSNH